MLRPLPLALLLGLSAGCAASAPSPDEAIASEDALTSSARPTKLAEFKGSYGPLRLSATHVYFYDHPSRAIRRVPKIGGEVQTVLSIDSAVRDFAVDAFHVWAVVDRSGSHDWKFGEIVRVPLAGGAVETRLGGDLALARIALDATDVYVAAAGKLVRFPKTGDFLAPESLEEDVTNVSALTVDATHVYWADMGPGNPAIGCNVGDGKLMARTKRGGTARAIATREDCPLTIAIEGGFAWYRSFFGPLRRVALAGGGSTMVTANTFSDPAFDTTSVFFSAPAGVSTQLESQGKVSGTAKSYLGTRTDTPQQAISAIAVDTLNAYYAVLDHGTGVTSIQRVAKQ